MSSLTRRMFLHALRAAAVSGVLVATGGFVWSWTSKPPKVWHDWDAHDEANSATIDHSAWDRFLATYVSPDDNGLNRVAYAEVSAADRAKLDDYLKTLSAVTITGFARAEQLAYWINLYNALTVKVILDHYPVKSIRDIDISGILADGPWGKPLVSVEGKRISLDNIEHEILRPIWKDPRIHYALNCASIGCPNLQMVAFTGQNVGTLIDKGAAEFINSDRGLLTSGGKIVVSSIYGWFAYDFGNSKQGVIRHLLKYANGERAAALKAAGTIHDTRYDWSLNE